MSFPNIPAALTYERQNTLLEKAQTARQARQARTYRRAHGARAIHGSSLCWAPGRPACVSVASPGQLAAAIQV